MREKPLLGILRAVLIAGALTGGLTACLPGETTTVSRPEGGPFDPGQNGLPDQLRVESICGTTIVGYLRNVTEKYFDVAREWDRYVTYADGVSEDGITAEEYAGAEQRSSNVAGYLESYRESAEALRIAGGEVTGDFVADCDREVLVTFEAIYQERETEIGYVETENQRLTRKLAKNAGVEASG